jgi:2-C-methyl-D-erythritol 4-phosphate cytidylyltransferase/2-C-methyl-D-erythritol 2,4-cyclodiphosphate synthase
VGFDAHRFAPGRSLVIGGVSIEHDQGLSGHSDADVLSHAIGDALLGAAGLGDLGEHFPSNERWRDASSLALLGEIAKLVAGAGWSVSNVDATVVAEAPRLNAHVGEMKAKIAGALGVVVELVSVKATTTDGMGFTGTGEGIACYAVASLQSADAGY